MMKALLVIILVCTQYNSFSNNTVPEFTAVFDARKNAVLIRWQNKSPDIRSFIIQRSSDNSSWTDIALQDINPNAATRSFYFEDKKPTVGENFYRLKCISINGKIEYSVVIIVIVASPVNSWVIYPVPVKDVLTLEYKGNEKIKGVINIVLQQSSGNILTKLRYASLNRIIRIPVDNLGKGFYDITIIVQGEIIWHQRFVK